MRVNFISGMEKIKRQKVVSEVDFLYVEKNNILQVFSPQYEFFSIQQTFIMVRDPTNEQKKGDFFAANLIRIFYTRYE